jgi:hypothetical protein
MYHSTPCGICSNWSGGNFEIFGFIKFRIFVCRLGSKSLFQSHYCHLSQWAFKFIWGGEEQNILGGCTPPTHIHPWQVLRVSLWCRCIFSYTWEITTFMPAQLAHYWQFLTLTSTTEGHTLVNFRQDCTPEIFKKLTLPYSAVLVAVAHLTLWTIHSPWIYGQRSCSREIDEECSKIAIVGVLLWKFENENVRLLIIHQINLADVKLYNIVAYSVIKEYESPHLPELSFPESKARSGYWPIFDETIWSDSWGNIFKGNLFAKNSTVT